MGTGWRHNKLFSFMMLPGTYANAGWLAATIIARLAAIVYSRARFLIFNRTCTPP